MVGRAAVMGFMLLLAYYLTKGSNPDYKGATMIMLIFAVMLLEAYNEYKLNKRK